MKLRYLTAIILVVILTCQNIYADMVVPSNQVKNVVRVRSSPSKEASVSGRLYLGESAEYIRSEQNWRFILLKNGVEGYVDKNMTRLIPGSSLTWPLEFHFLNVGQGDSTLIVCPNNKKILIDAGSESIRYPHMVRDYILRTIYRHHGNKKIDTLIITHPDSNHYNLLRDILRYIVVEQVFFVGDQNDYNPTFWEWLSLQPNKTSLRSGYFDPQDTPNKAINCGNAEIYILASSDRSKVSRKEAPGIVLMVRHGNIKVILADSTFDTENKIMERYSEKWLDVPILKVANHGDFATSTSQKWLSVVKPLYTLISAGYNNSYGYPRKEIIKRLEEYTMEGGPHLMTYATEVEGLYKWHTDSQYKESIFSTAVNGTIVLTSTGERWSINLLPLGAPPPSRENLSVK